MGNVFLAPFSISSMSWSAAKPFEAEKLSKTDPGGSADWMGFVIVACTAFSVVYSSLTNRIGTVLLQCLSLIYDSEPLSFRLTTWDTKLLLLSGFRRWLVAARMTKKKLLPWLIVLVTLTSPPNCSAMSLLKLRPRPVPSIFFN